MNRHKIELLYQKFGPSVLRRARAILRDEHAAQDAMQEVFIKAIRAWDEFEGTASPMTWLYRITTNYCLNQIRDAKRRRTLLAAREAEVRPAPPPDVLERQDALRVLEQVPEDLRATAICFYLDEMTQAEAAEHLGISRRTVGYRLQAFRESVRSFVGSGKLEG